MDTAVPDRLNVLEVAKPDCVADDFDDEIVVLNLATGVYFSLRHLAAAVWRDLAAGHSVPSLISGIGRMDERAAAATAAVVEHFEQNGLMRPGSSRPVDTVEPESIALINTGEARLTIETFEDMKDLILSDPIHDSDESMGWPAVQHADKT